MSPNSHLWSLFLFYLNSSYSLVFRLVRVSTQPQSPKQWPQYLTGQWCQDYHPYRCWVRLRPTTWPNASRRSARWWTHWWHSIYLTRAHSSPSFSHLSSWPITSDKLSEYVFIKNFWLSIHHKTKWHWIPKKPALFCADGKFRWFLVANVPKISELYWPPIWAIQTHFQTALANYLRGRLPELPYYRLVY